MPFTPAHPAIVLPLLRSKYFSATALIVGSMAPDFEYFFKMDVNGEHGHTLGGIFYFDLPVTLFLAFVFHRMVKDNLINNLPSFLQTKFSDVKQLDFENYLRKHWVIFITSAILGSLSHIFWDSFTHLKGFFVQHLDFYKGTVVPFDGVKYPLYYALQHLSTYTGLTILFVYIICIKPKTIKMAKPHLSYWIILIVTSLLILFLRFYWLPETFNLVTAVVSSITSLCIALIIAGQIRFTYQLN